MNIIYEILTKKNNTDKNKYKKKSPVLSQELEIFFILCILDVVDNPLTYLSSTILLATLNLNLRSTNVSIE